MKVVVRKTLLLGSFIAGSAHAADLVPTSFKAIETDLARSELQLTSPYSFRLGLNFKEGHRYLLHPSKASTEDASAIRRELNFGLMLPFNLETGLSLYDTQQAQSNEMDALYGKVEHKAQKLGGALYARLHLVQSEGLRSSIILQFEPGTADRSSFAQPSQDKTGIAIAVDGTPVEYLQIGAYLGMTKRENEKFRKSRINDEVLYGARFSAGPEYLKLFGDMGIRSLPWRTIARGDTMHTGRHYEIGLQGSYADLHIQASKYIPTTERFVGEPEKGFKISLTYVFGKARSGSSGEKAKDDLEEVSKDDLEKDVEAPKDQPKEVEEPAPVSATPPAGESFESLMKNVKEEELGPIPVFKDNIPRKSKTEVELDSHPEALAAPGADEFEKWEKTQEADSKRPLSPQEVAEREYVNQIAQDKLKAEKTAIDEKSAEEIEKEKLLKEIEDEEKKSSRSMKDIEKELNEYTLPDDDDVNWNGLGNK